MGMSVDAGRRRTRPVVKAIPEPTKHVRRSVGGGESPGEWVSPDRYVSGAATGGFAECCLRVAVTAGLERSRPHLDADARHIAPIGRAARSLSSTSS